MPNIEEQVGSEGDKMEGSKGWMEVGGVGVGLPCDGEKVSGLPSPSPGKTPQGLIGSNCLLHQTPKINMQNPKYANHQICRVSARQAVNCSLLQGKQHRRPAGPSHKATLLHKLNTMLHIN